MKNKDLRRIMAVGIMAVTVLGTGIVVNAGEAAPESIGFTAAAHILPEVGAEFDIASILEITGENANEEIIYSTYDDTVAEVNEEGMLVANGLGITTIIASSAVDETICASIDVAVCEVYGTYSGVKTIEVMGCDIAIDLTLEEDGTYSYYRAPMNIAMEGGGEMPELTDEGTYEMNGVEVTFASELLGDYTISFQIGEDGTALTGKIPTGGPSTEMELVKVETEETEEEGTTEETEQETEAEEVTE